MALVSLGWFVPAFAQPVPGAGGDPLRELMVDPAFAYTDAPSGLAVRGGDPEDTLLVFDGFEMPWAFHPGGLRSLVPPDGADVALAASSFGVEYGRGTSLVTISPRSAQQTIFGELTAVDASFHSGSDRVGSTIRLGYDALADEWRPTTGHSVLDMLAHLDVRVSKRWTLPTSVIGTRDDERSAYRIVTGARYASPTWSAMLAVSPLLASTRRGLDARAELVRRAPRGAGLANLEWRLGHQASATQYQLATTTPWLHDLAAWTSLAANLSSRVRASAGVRVDDFDGDFATQPRGTLSIRLTPHLELALAAGAYRRPPRTRVELEAGALNPERATQLAATATFDENRGYRVAATAYHIDRRRLVAPDAAGVLGNTGVGTSSGAELSAALRGGPWRARIAASLARSTRTDYPRARTRPAASEQPFRLELIGGWAHRRLAVSARLQLASGLPYTPYDRAVYDSDTDTWTPRYVEPLSARTPFHHQIDLRVDYQLATGVVKLAAFIDLHNAYGNQAAIDYVYSYDYAQRAAITALPVFPFAGLRAYL